MDDGSNVNLITENKKMNTTSKYSRSMSFDQFKACQSETIENARETDGNIKIKVEYNIKKWASHLRMWILSNACMSVCRIGRDWCNWCRTLQRVRLANRGCLLLRTPVPVPFGTCICSNVETILSWTSHVYGPFEFRTSLSTSMLPFKN